ncbi:MAG: zinc ABC transporter substrate-binding protein [Clostridiales bacterium]|nr:zinc ABC transporter substrate-binding protein [Clostridiales bacterium]
MNIMMRIRSWGRLVLCGLLVCALTGAAACAKPDDEEQEAGLRVLASFTPVYALTLAVADGAENVTVECMTSQTAGCPHDYQLTPADMQKVEEADLLVLNGAGMEDSFTDKIFSQYPDLPSVESAQGLELLPELGEHDRNHPGHEEEGNNPHTWLSLQNAKKQAQRIADFLSEHDPANKAVYAANVQRFTEAADRLDSVYRPALEALPHRKLITFHAAFAYLAADYGLQVTAVIESTPGTAPDPQTLQGLIEEAKNQGITAIFTEPQYPDSTAKVIADGTGARIYTLDPLVTGETDQDSYLAGMEENFKILIQALA